MCSCGNISMYNHVDIDIFCHIDPCMHMQSCILMYWDMNACLPKTHRSPAVFEDCRHSVWEHVVVSWIKNMQAWIKIFACMENKIKHVLCTWNDRYHACMHVCANRLEFQKAAAAKPTFLVRIVALLAALQIAMWEESDYRISRSACMHRVNCRSGTMLTYGFCKLSIYWNLDIMCCSSTISRHCMAAFPNS